MILSTNIFLIMHLLIGGGYAILMLYIYQYKGIYTPAESQSRCG